MFSMRFAIILLITCAILAGQVENKSIFGIGMRIIGDQLLVKDVLESRSTGLDQNPTIGFNYAIPEPITYIEILSEENVLAEVNFSYQNDLVKGTIEAINSTMDDEGIQKPLEVLITIYGFNETMLNLNPSYILNRDQQFEGIMEPFDEDDTEDDADGEYLNLSEEAIEDLRDNQGQLVDDDDDDDDEDDDADDEDIADNDFDWDFENTDKIIEVGHRQNGDYLIYETYQTTLSTTEEPADHSVVFYYIDDNFITYVRFIVFDHTVDKAPDDQTLPVASYSHYSPSTLKAVITDYNTKNLFVKMFLYGYKPIDLPVGYMPFLTNIGGVVANSAPAGGTTDSPISPLQRLKMLINAQPESTAIRMDAQGLQKELAGQNVQMLHSNNHSNNNQNALNNDGDNDNDDDDDDDGDDAKNDARIGGVLHDLSILTPASGLAVIALISAARWQL